jgi:hypothetical protein
VDHVKQELDGLLAAWKAAVDEWREAIRAEEDFATPDHSMREWEAWDRADFKEEEARGKAKKARKAYNVILISCFGSRANVRFAVTMTVG